MLIGLPEFLRHIYIYIAKIWPTGQQDYIYIFTRTPSLAHDSRGGETIPEDPQLLKVGGILFHLLVKPTAHKAYRIISDIGAGSAQSLTGSAN